MRQGRAVQLDPGISQLTPRLLSTLKSKAREAAFKRCFQHDLRHYNKGLEFAVAALWLMSYSELDPILGHGDVYEVGIVLVFRSSFLEFNKYSDDVTNIPMKFSPRGWAHLTPDHPSFPCQQLNLITRTWAGGYVL